MENVGFAAIEMEEAYPIPIVVQSNAREEIFDCLSSGVPHQHVVNRIIARKLSA